LQVPIAAQFTVFAEPHDWRFSGTHFGSVLTSDGSPAGGPDLRSQSAAPGQKKSATFQSAALFPDKQTLKVSMLRRHRAPDAIWC
jgi:hypothetical protein